MQPNQEITDTPARRSWRPWMIVLTLVVLILITISAGTYAFNWTWTGLRGNTLWDWLRLIIVPAALGFAKILFHQHRRWRLETIIVIGGTLFILIFLEFATYLFKWSWTGFASNTLWDWLNLLLLPLTVTLVSVWFSAPPRWHSLWVALMGGSLAILALLTAGSYLFNWTWSGLKGNTLWDWASLLLVPIMLVTVTIWFTAPATRREKTDSFSLISETADELDQIPTLRLHHRN